MKPGEILIYPTESSYALGCRYDDKSAIRQMMKLKGRTDDRFTVIASSIKQVKQHFKFTPAMESLAKRYWPGALSIVVSNTFAVRVPALPLARQLAADCPIIATSLNVSGEPPIFDLRLVKTRLIASLLKDHIIDIGPLPHRPPSTVVECFRGGYVIHRLGAVNVL